MGKRGMYSDKMNPELNMSLAKMVPNGLCAVSRGVGQVKRGSLPRYVRVCFDHLFGCSLEEDFASCRTGSFKIDCSSYTTKRVKS
jgi:hypothetical protein